MSTLLKKNGSPYWHASFVSQHKTRTSKSTGVLHTPENAALTEINRNAAQKIGDEFERRAGLGIPLDDNASPAGAALPGIPTFEVFVESWLAGLGGQKKYQEKMRNYFANISKYLETKIHWQIHLFHRQEFTGLIPFLLTRNYSPTTATFHLKALRAMFMNAMNEGFILSNPISKADYVENPVPNIPVALEIPQLEHLLNSNKIIDWRTTMLFGFYGGMDLLEAVSRSWPEIDFDKDSITWTACHTGGKPCPITMPLHPALKEHLSAVKKVSGLERVTPSLKDVSESALTANFRKIVTGSELANAAMEISFRRKFSKIQFSSLKLTFARCVGHTGLFRLSRYIRHLNPEELKAKVLSLPHLKLNPLPLLKL